MQFLETKNIQCVHQFLPGADRAMSARDVSIFWSLVEREEQDGE